MVNKHTRNRFFNNGETKVLVLEVLKNSKLPISTDKISDIIVTKRNVSFENKTDKSNFQKSIYQKYNHVFSLKTKLFTSKYIYIYIYLLQI